MDNDSDPTNDLSGHGTHVAGIIADCTIGLPVYIYPIRVLNAAGGGKISNCVNAIYEACSREVDVINLSMSTTTASDALDQAIRDAVNEGITIVAAAGNQNRDTQTIYPAHLQDEGVIVVGSVEPIAGDESGICRKASYSNYGKSVDVYTFGTNIEGCSITGDYVTKSGTSQAAPHVSSLCAMLYLLHPEELPWQMEHRIMAGTVSQEGMRIVETLNMIPQEEGFFLEQIQLLQGENVCFPSYAYPLTCLEKINYESMDPSVVKVEDNSIKGLAQGSTTVRATCLGLPEKMFTVYVQEKMVDVLEESDPPQIVLPKGLKQIREHAFDQCPSLRFITLPASLEQIEDNNFSGAIVICGYGSKAEQYCKDRNIPYLCNDT